MEQLTLESKVALDNCLANLSKKVDDNSRRVLNSTDTALDKGEFLLGCFRECAKKPVLNVVGCYRKAIVDDVLPVKQIIISAMKIHKEGHSEFTKIRTDAGLCVDKILKEYEDSMLKMLKIN